MGGGGEGGGGESCAFITLDLIACWCLTVLKKVWVNCESKYSYINFISISSNRESVVCFIFPFHMLAHSQRDLRQIFSHFPSLPHLLRNAWNIPRSSAILNTSVICPTIFFLVVLQFHRWFYRNLTSRKIFKYGPLAEKTNAQERQTSKEKVSNQKANKGLGPNSRGHATKERC